VPDLSVPRAILDAMKNQIPPNVRDLARFQGGVVTRRQALNSGLSTGAITSRLKYQKWRQIYWGVYVTFTGPVSREAQLWAAVLYAGKGARLSHQTAAELHGLTVPPTPLIHVTVPATRRVRPTGNMVIHICASTAEPTFPPGVIPRTLVEETVLDLAHAARGFDDACAWVTAAFGQGLTTERKFRATMKSRKRLRWRARLDDVVTAAAGGTHSPLEYRYDSDVERAHGLPAAMRQVPFTKPDGRRGYRDRYYREFGLVIELDGKQAHPDERRRQDRRRDNAATALGGSTLRYDWDDVTHETCATAAQVAEALRARGWTGRPKPCSRSCRALEPAEGGKSQPDAAPRKAA
jgi:hypothetical protein